LAGRLAGWLAGPPARLAGWLAGRLAGPAGQAEPDHMYNELFPAV